MIQFNLLPEVKMEFIKARRSKQMVLFISLGVASVFLAIFLVLFAVANVLQPKHINDLSGDVKKYTKQLQEIPDLDKVLTIQNQLGSLTSLHENVPLTSRLVDFLGQVTPAKVTISNVKLDLKTNTMTLDGNADSLSTINQFVDTLKFTTFTTPDNTKPQPAFSNVVLGGFSSGEKGSTYSISLTYDPTLFKGTEQVTLSVPKIVSTRSEVDKPSDLFQQGAKQ